jgi:hypothetical protein
MNIFRITIPDHLSKYPGYIAPEMPGDEVSSLGWAVVILSEMYWTREWSMQVAEQKFIGYFEDIVFLWDDLPAMLNAVKLEPRQFPMVATINQGTEKLVYIEADNPDEVLVTIVSSENTDHFWDYYNLLYPPDPNEFPRIRLIRADFIAEWLHFINTLVAMMIREALIERDDASLQEYLKSLP